MLPLMVQVPSIVKSERSISSRPSPSMPGTESPKRSKSQSSSEGKAVSALLEAVPSARNSRMISSTKKSPG